MVPQWWRKFTLVVIGKCEKRGNDAMILENAAYPPSAGAAKKRRVKYMPEERHYEKCGTSYTYRRRMKLERPSDLFRMNARVLIGSLVIAPISTA